MILSTLKAVCAAMHKKTASDLTVNGVDLFLVAANNVRRNKGELLHNFEYARCLATLDVNGVLGGSLDDAVISGGSSTTYTVTGTLSPDKTGVYIQFGLINGLPAFTLPGTPSYLYYSAANNVYVLNGFGIEEEPDNNWTKTVVGTVIAGSYAPFGVNTGTATVTQSSTSVFSKVKEIVAISRMRPDGTYIPLDFARADIPIERDRTELEFSDNLFPYLRYPSDAQINSRGTSSSMIQRGRRVEIYPFYASNDDTTFSVRLEAYGLLNDYTAANLLDTQPTDFFVEYGNQFMQWSIINELNYYFKTFVPRTEGNLSPPEQKATDAWRDLLLWDTYQVDANTTRSR